MYQSKAEIVNNLGSDLPQLTIQVVCHSDFKYTGHMCLAKMNPTTMLYLLAHLDRHVSRVKDHFVSHVGATREELENKIVLIAQQ